MNKIKLSEKNLILTVFVAVESLLYIVFNVISILQPYESVESIVLKYLSIILCLICATVMLFKYYRNKDAVLVVVALIFTAISDLFILVLDECFDQNGLFPLQYNIGLFTFMIAHCIYLYRLYADRIKKIWITLVVRAVLIAILAGVVCGLSGFNLLVFEACFYIVILGGNVVDGFIICKRSRKNLLFAIGLLCFLLCDIFVGLQNADMLGIDIRSAYRIITNFIWIFYVPAQVLFVLSISKDGMSNKIEKPAEELIKDDES